MYILMIAVKLVEEYEQTPVLGFSGCSMKDGLKE